MKSAALRLSAAGLACAGLLACHTGVGGHLSEPDKDEIRKVVEEAARTVLPPISDLDAYVKLYYADDARVLPPNHATVTGREAISALYRTSGSIQEYKLTILALDGRNDLAYVHSAYQITVMPPGAAEPGRPPAAQRPPGPNVRHVGLRPLWHAGPGSLTTVRARA